MTRSQEGAAIFLSLYREISGMPSHNPYIHPGLNDGGSVEHILWSGEWAYDPFLGSIETPTVGYVTLEKPKPSTSGEIIIARRLIYYPAVDDDSLEARMILRQVGPGRNVEFLPEPIAELEVPDRTDAYLKYIMTAVQVARSHPDRVVRVQ